MKSWQYAVADAVRTTREFFQDQWFDRTRHVHTRGELVLSAAGVRPEEMRDSEQYQPARPAHIRQALAAAPVYDASHLDTARQGASQYTYIDLGSGKGRTLFVAAELPFRRIIGVEFSQVLHAVACANIQSFRFRGQRCHAIESRLENAMDFVFPGGPLVIYLFNPFGAETVRRVLYHLEESLHREPRHVVLILLWQQCAAQVARMEGMRLVRAAEGLHIFETHPPASP